MELGGEFYLDLNTLSEKNHSVDACLSGEQPLYFDSGRSALRFAARSLRPGTILLPEYICDSVITAFSGHTLRFYRLTPSLEIVMDDLLSKLNGEVSAVFLMHYFGAVQPRAILEQLEAARRRRNYARLKDALVQLGVSPICRIAEDACPLVLPVRVKDRDALRRRLMEHRIYCAVHWPFDGVQADERPLTRTLAAQMLSLPIDQRYDTAHIDYLMDTLDTYKGLLL